MRRHLLLALIAPVAHGWTASPPPPRCRSSLQRARLIRLGAEPQRTSGAATGEEIGDDDKTEGIPNYMIRTSGTIVRLAEGADSATAVTEDGVLFDSDCQVSIVTSDVIEMVQQQGGSAEKIDYLGENILVEGMLFDDFKAEDIFEVAPAGTADGTKDEVVTLEIIEARSSSALELGQLGDDEDKKRSIESITSIAPGFSGWTARVVAAGRVRAGFTIAKRDPSPA